MIVIDILYLDNNRGKMFYSFNSKSLHFIERVSSYDSSLDYLDCLHRKPDTSVVRPRD